MMIQRVISRNFGKDRVQLLLLAFRQFSSNESNQNNSNQPPRDGFNDNNTSRQTYNSNTNRNYNSNYNNHRKYQQPFNADQQQASQHGQQTQRDENVHSSENKYSTEAIKNYNANNANRYSYSNNSNEKKQYRNYNNNNRNNSASSANPSSSSNLKSPPTYLCSPHLISNTLSSDQMITLLSNPQSFQSNSYSPEILQCSNLLQSEINSQSAYKNITKEIQIFWQLFITCQALAGTSCEDLITELQKSNKIDNLILGVLIGNVMDIIKSFSVQKRLSQLNISMELILKRGLLALQKYQIIDTLAGHEEEFITVEKKLINLLYYFHANKILRQAHNKELNQLYAKLVEIYQEHEVDPSFEFALNNIAMLSDIKLKDKHEYQEFKICYSRFIRRCINQLLKSAENISSYQWVFMLYKMAIIDCASFGLSVDAFWLKQEERMLKELNDLSLVQRKSLLYSIGKNAHVNKTSMELCKNLIDLQHLQPLSAEPKFLEYFGNILLAGMGRLMIGKEEIEKLLPFILSMLRNNKVNEREKIEFLGAIIPSVYKIGVMDRSLWAEFFGRSNEMLNDPQKLFNCYFIAKTFDSVYNSSNKAKKSGVNSSEDMKYFSEQTARLSAKISALHHYQDMLKKIVYKTTQKKQSLYELRFHYNLNAFGKEFVQEHFINDLISVDFFLIEDRIAIEIQGHQHYTLLQDGSVGLSLPSQFKLNYLESIGVKVIQIGPNFLPDQPYVSSVRQFLEQYQDIIKQREQGKLAEQQK